MFRISLLSFTHNQPGSAKDNAVCIAAPGVAQTCNNTWNTSSLDTKKLDKYIYIKTLGQGCSICSVTTLLQHRDRIRDRIRDRTVIVKLQNFFPSDHDRCGDIKLAHILGDMGRYRPIPGNI